MWFVKACVHLWIVLLGTSVGSFVNVVISRLPGEGLFERARSHCPVCGEQLGWRDLIPIMSYLSLKGRCRFCSQRISPRYPLVEGMMAAVCVLCFARFGLSYAFALSFAIMAVLFAISVIDHDMMEIPDSLTLSLAPAAVLSVLVWPQVTLLQRAVGFFVISLPMLAMAVVIDGAFGGGDIKLMAVCGFLLGWQGAILAFFIALVTGGGCAVILLAFAKKERGSHIAFGPHLCFGCAVSLLYGARIIGGYLDFFKL